MTRKFANKSRYEFKREIYSTDYCRWVARTALLRVMCDDYMTWNFVDDCYRVLCRFAWIVGAYINETAARRRGCLCQETRKQRSLQEFSVRF